jgi:hypothetical protein
MRLPEAAPPTVRDREAEIPQEAFIAAEDGGVTYSARPCAQQPLRIHLGVQRLRHPIVAVCPGEGVVG